MSIEIFAVYEPDKEGGEPFVYENTCDQFTFHDIFDRKLTMAGTDSYTGEVSLRTIENFSGPQIVPKAAFNGLFRRAGNRLELLPFIRTPVPVHRDRTSDVLTVYDLQYLPEVRIDHTRIPISEEDEA